MIRNIKATVVASKSTINCDTSVPLPLAIERQQVAFLIRHAGLTASRAKLIAKFAFQSQEAAK